MILDRLVPCWVLLVHTLLIDEGYESPRKRERTIVFLFTIQVVMESTCAWCFKGVLLYVSLLRLTLVQFFKFPSCRSLGTRDYGVWMDRTIGPIQISFRA